MPQNANVVASDIRKARITRRRIIGSANRSATVNRASAFSCAFKVAPLRSRSVAAWRCSLTRSHLSDSGMARRIHNVSSAGTTPSRNMTRQAFGPERVDEAARPPRPGRIRCRSRICIRPTPLPRFLSGHSSATIEVPVTHSEPMQTPTRNRMTANDVQSQAKALNPVMIE